nr:hypothetical protein [Sorangium cellulosum]
MPLPHRVVEALDHEHDRRVAGRQVDPERLERGRVGGLAREIHGADDRRVRGTRAQGAAREAQRPRARELLRRDRERRPRDVELAVQPVRRDVRHVPDHARRLEDRGDRIPQRADVDRRTEPRRRRVGEPPARHVPAHLGVGAHADEHGRALPRQREALGGLDRRLEQQRLLGERLLQIARREAQPIRGQRDVGAAGGRAAAREERLRERADAAELPDA